MIRDEYNNVIVTNESEKFTSFEYGKFQNNESTSYKDNSVGVKDEINDSTTNNHENSRVKHHEQELSKDDLKRIESAQTKGDSESSITTSSDEAVASSGGSTAAASSSGVAAATAGGATVAATIGAVIIAVPTIIAAAKLSTKVVDPIFSSSSNSIIYSLSLDVDENDTTREFGIYLYDTMMSMYQARQILPGYNEGEFYELMDETEYTINVIAFTKGAAGVYDIETGEFYEYVATTPPGEILYTTTVATLALESHVDGFTLSPEIDSGYFGESRYMGTGLTRYHLYYIDDFGVFDDFQVNIVGKEQDQVERNYTYPIAMTDSGVGYIDLISDDISGNPITLDYLLTDEGFDVYLSYTDSRVGSDERITLEKSSEVVFKEERTTFFELESGEYYYEDGSDYVIPMTIDYSGFDLDSIYSWTISVSATNDFVVDQTIDTYLPSVESGKEFECRIPISDVSSKQIELEYCAVRVGIYYYNRDIILADTSLTLSSGQTVSGATVPAKADFDQGIAYITLDFADHNEIYSEFQVEFISSQGTAGQNSHTFDLTKTTSEQELRFGDNGLPLSDSYTYTVSYYDSSLGNRVSLASKTARFFDADATFKSYYMSLGDGGDYDDTIYVLVDSSQTINFEDFNLRLYPSSNPSNSSDYVIESDSSEFQMINVLASEMIWDMTSTFTYQINGSYADPNGEEIITETFDTGTVSFEVAPNVRNFNTGNLYQMDAFTGGKSYFLPVNLDILDPIRTYAYVYIMFGVDDLEYTTPVDSDQEYWSQQIQISTRYNLAIEEDMTVASGWRNLDITSLMSDIYNQTGGVSDGDRIKYTVYTDMTGEDPVEYFTNYVTVDFTSNDVYGISSEGILSGSNEFTVYVGYTNNDPEATDGIEAMYIHMSFNGEDYYAELSMSNPGSIYVNLENLYDEAPTASGFSGQVIDPDLVGDLFNTLTDSIHPCTLSLMYKMVGSSTLTLCQNSTEIYFIANV